MSQRETAAAHRLGIAIGGCDTPLDRGTPHDGEVAVVLAHLIDGDASEETS